MPRKQKKYHFVYKTTNTVNGKFYVGMHSTDDLDDGYIGSGKYLWNSIRKYGRDKFVIERLEFFDTRELLVEREKMLVNDELLKDSLCMNLREGGKGGWTSEQQKLNAIKANIKLKILRETDPDWVIKKSKNQSTGHIKSYQNGRVIKTPDWNGREHKQSTKDKIGRANSIKQGGTNNSQHGTCWINNPELKETKKIKIESLREYIQLGWIQGRKLKW